MKLRSPISPPRREDGSLLPAALLALLVLAAGAQFVLTGDPDLPEEGVGRVAPAAAIGGLGRTAAPPVVLARPLFSPTRSLEARPVGTGPEVDAGPLGGAYPVGVLARGRAARLFLRLPDGGVRVLPVGGSYNGWRVTALTGDGVLFVRGSDRVRMKFGAAHPVAGGPAGGGGSDDESEEE